MGEAKGDVSSMVYAVTYAGMFLNGFLGNIITLLVIFKGTAFRTVGEGRLFLANLAVVDLLGSIQSLTSAIGYIDPDWIKNNQIFCEFEGGHRWFVGLLTTSSLMILSVNRYIAAKFPWKINTIFSLQNSCITICASWVFCMLITLSLKLVDPQPASFRQFEGSCLLQTNTTTALVLMGSIFFPFTTTICYCNMAIQKIVRGRSNRIVNKTIPSENTLQHRNLRLLKIALVILFSYLVTNTPIPVCMITDFILGKPIPLVWYRFCKTLVMMNHAVNIFIYAVIDKAYRNQVKNLFRRCRRDQYPNQSVVSGMPFS